MILIWIDESERYPFYSFTEEVYACAIKAEISETELEWLNRVSEEWLAVQRFLRGKMEE